MLGCRHVSFEQARVLKYHILLSGCGHRLGVTGPPRTATGVYNSTPHKIGSGSIMPGVPVRGTQAGCSAQSSSHVSVRIGVVEIHNINMESNTVGKCGGSNCGG